MNYTKKNYRKRNKKVLSSSYFKVTLIRSCLIYVSIPCLHEGGMVTRTHTQLIQGVTPGGAIIVFFFARVGGATRGGGATNVVFS